MRVKEGTDLTGNGKHCTTMSWEHRRPCMGGNPNYWPNEIRAAINAAGQACLDHLAPDYYPDGHSRG